jgi:hypothetical protein
MASAVRSFCVRKIGLDKSEGICYNKENLIKSGGGTGPVKPGNLIAAMQ